VVVVEREKRGRGFFYERKKEEYFSTAMIHAMQYR
jgi:hypothetical protein